MRMIKPRERARPTANLDVLEPRQLLAAAPGALRINAGGDWFTDSLARTFAPASSASAGTFVGGRDASSAVVDLASTADDALFATRRIGAHFTFAAPVAAGQYALFVEFADTADTAAGQRVFDVTAEGSLLADDLDLFVRAGNDAFAVERDVTIADGMLNIAFDASAGEALVNAIVLVPTDVPIEARPYDPTRNTSEAANTVLSASRLVAIGQAVTLDANNHHGVLPTTLAGLFPTAQLSVETLTNPRAATRPPRGVLSAIEQRAYAQTLDDYRYLGAGLKTRNLTATLPLAYENPGRAAGNINVLFGDGHVETLARADAAARIGFANIAPTNAAPPVSYTAADLAVVRSQSNLRAISRAALLYSNEHRGRYPATIGELEDYVTSPSVFGNPRLGSAAAPPPPSTLTPEEKIAWVNAHSDYALPVASASNSMPPANVLIYEKPAGLLSGLNLVMGDGSVIFREFRYAYESVAAVASPLVIEAGFDVASGELRVRFDEDASAGLSSGDLVVTNLATGQAIAASSLIASYDFATQTARFAPVGGLLPDGNYTATLAAGSIADVSGKPLAVATSFNFFTLAGDVDHDRDVDFDDLIVIAQHYGQSGRTFAEGNLNHDAAGRVDFDDLVLLSQRYGKTLAGPALMSSVVAAKTKRKSHQN